MRALVVVVVLALVFVLIGWLRFSSSDGDPTVQIDSDKVKQDTSAFVEKSKEFVEDTAGNIGDAAKDLEPKPN